MEISNIDTNLNIGRFYQKINFKDNEPQSMASAPRTEVEANVVYSHLDGVAAGNKALPKGNIQISPSGIEDYENYIELDKHGNVIASIEYAKENGALVQKIKTKSPDGTVLEKT